MSTPEESGEPDKLVFDVVEADFAEAVVAASREVIVLVDFWASWCEPCHELGVILETLVEEADGALRLARVDTDKEQRLAAMFRVQSLPLVVAFKDGRPADVLSGAVPLADVRAFLEKLGVEFAKTTKPQVKEITPLMQVQTVLRQGSSVPFAEITKKLNAIDEDMEDYTDAQRLLAAGPWFSTSYPAQGEAAELASAAQQSWLAGELRQAIAKLLESVSADRSWQDELGRKALVALMQLVAEDRDFVDATRRRLALLLY